MSNGSRASDHQDLDAIVEDIAALKKDIAALMSHAKESATETVTGETRRLYDALSSESEETLAALTRRIEERPVSSILIAFGLGFIGAHLLKR